MDIFEETILAADEKISFQFFMPIGESGAYAKNSSHILFDNRIIGLNFWFRPFGDEDWHMLTELDLLIHKVQSIRISKSKHDTKTQKLEQEKQRLINSNGMVKR